MFTLNCKGKLLVIDKPLVMGIINTTPDSFHAASRVSGNDAVLERADQMLTEGASILDIGGQSTRPGSERVSYEEESRRVTSAIEAIHSRFPEAVISVDTYHAKVAAEAVAAGASIVNDIGAGNMDADMLPTVAALQVPYICMHMLGTPLSMQQQPVYENIAREVLDFFIHKIAECTRLGINDVIVDPGFGFGKNSQHNLSLLKQMGVLKMLEKPLLVGFSRKTTIYKTLGITAAEALNGTTVINTISLMNGAHILRVHDVKEAMEAVKLFVEYEKS
ncbi:MAG: dihydropteroate synthase [Chitinophagaceae bacterium]